MSQHVGTNVPKAEPLGCDVVIPFHNQFELVRQAIHSMLAQQHARCWIHLIDDASTEDPQPLYTQFAHLPNVCWYQNPQNIGPYRSFHRAVPHCRSDFIAIQDGDDVAAPHRISISATSLMEHGGDVFASAAAAFVGEPSDVTHVLRSKAPRGRNNASLINGTMVVRRDFFVGLNGFADFFCGADTEFVIRAYYSGAKFVVSRKCLLSVRKHGRSLSRDRRTGFWGLRHENVENRESVSSYRARVWAEIDRRFPTFCAGDFDPRHFGCLDPAQSRTMGCVGEPCPVET